MKELNHLSSWPRLLLTFPFAIRLTILTLCFLLCQIIYILVFPVTHNGYIMVIPVALAAWMFRKRGLLILFSVGLFIMLVYHTIRLGTIWWPATFVLLFLLAVCILLMIGFIVVALRNFVDASDTAREQAQQATQQLASAYEQQRQLNQLKTQFILNVNHELRTPLTVVSGYLSILQLVLDQSGHLDRTAHGAYLESAVKKCEELRSLVNRVLNTQVPDDQSEPFTFREIAVAATVRDVLEQSGSIERATHKIQLDIPEQLAVWAEVHGLQHVLHNLLSNAFKYSPPDTLIAISATLCSDADQERQEAPCVCICVNDNGSGIPAHEIPLLFRQFVRLQRDLAGSVRGSGLGLYISKNIVEAMGGRIWVESTGIPGEGSCFYFTLPSAPDQVIAPAMGNRGIAAGKTLDF